MIIEGKVSPMEQEVRRINLITYEGRKYGKKFKTNIIRHDCIGNVICIVDDISRDSVLYQKKSVNMLVIDIAGTQVTNNVELSSHDQLPQFPSSATLNYIFKGNYYAWKSMNVMLRANATGTNAGFTVTGRWNPNAGTAYSGQ